MKKYRIGRYFSSVMTRKTLFCLFFSLFLYFFSGERLYSLPPQKILHPDDWAYEAIAILSREQGRVLLADTRVTVAQMERYLQEINADALSASGLVIYDRLAAYLASDPGVRFQSDVMSGGFDLILQPELYYKSNEDNLWIYNDHARNPVLQLPLGFSLSPWITAEMDVYLGQNEYAATLHDNYVNIPLDPVAQADIHFPKRAYVSAGLPVGKASGFNLAVGIGDNFFGKTRTGSIIVSEHLERTAYAQASVYSPAFKYTAQILQYEVNKYHYMHYFQIRPHRTISVSLAEGVMANTPLELRFMNPFTIFHGYESYKTYKDYNDDGANGGDERVHDFNTHSRIGSYFGIKLEFQPVRYVRFYGLFVMDVLNLPMKKNRWDETLYPDAAGFQAGTEFSLPVKGGYWEFGLEGVYTYPYLYIMWDKGWSFYKEVPELDIMKEKTGTNLRYWTGTPFGPDTIAGTLWAGFRSSSQWYGGFSFTFSAQGKHSSLTIFDHDTEGDTYRPSHAVYDVTVPPSGKTPVYTYTVNLRGEYSPRKWLNFALQPGYRITVNTGDSEDRIYQGFEVAFSLRYTPLSR
ncbi:MAG: hypothetical protein LBB89_12675 [Treponema sp.]|nr:hypothetical protein [Treponema sp.]